MLQRLRSSQPAAVLRQAAASISTDGWARMGCSTIDMTMQSARPETASLTTRLVAWVKWCSPGLTHAAVYSAQNTRWTDDCVASHGPLLRQAGWMRCKSLTGHPLSARGTFDGRVVERHQRKKVCCLLATSESMVLVIPTKSVRRLESFSDVVCRSSSLGVGFE